jgi:DNA polymerase-1
LSIQHSQNRLFLIDGMAMAYRAYFALINNPRINSQGLNTSAPFGFLNSLNEVIKNQKPTHLAVVFDTPEPTFRHQEYPPYKANRQEMPEDLSESLPWVRKIISAMHIPVLRLPGYEADDIIGTLVRRADADGFESYMVTPDKDFAQLVTDKTNLYRLGFGRNIDVMGPAEVCEKWGVATPLQVIDVLGLQGDASDNIPGVPGVGPKTAVKLLAEHGSVEAIIKAAPTVKGKLGERLREHADQAILSKRLATICLEVPIEVNWEDLTLDEPDKDALLEIFAELEFRTVAKRMFGEHEPLRTAPAPSSGQLELDLFGAPVQSEAVPPSTADTIKTVNHDYQLVTDPVAVEALFAEFAKADAFAFDFETDGLDVRACNVLGVALSSAAHKAFYVPFPESTDDQLALLKKFEVALHAPNEKIVHNASFDFGLLRWRGISWGGTIFDTMLADYLLAGDARHKMDDVALRLLNYEPIPITDLIGPKGKNQKTLADLPLSQVADYAAEDADVTFRIAEIQRPKLTEDKLDNLFHKVECPLIDVLLEMSHNGISIDLETLQAISAGFGEELARLTGSIHELAESDFNIDSPKQLGEILFEKLELSKKPKKTRTGQYATSEDILSKLKDKHAIIPLILRYRELRKLKNTYVDTLPKHVWPATNRIHTDFDQAGAVTGRLSSNNPNLQNIPIRTAEGREVRRAFVSASDELTLVAADYSQIELRIIAHLSKDPGLCGAFERGDDIHTATAAGVFDVDPLFVTDDMRRKAKMVNFGIAYGISAFGLSQRLGCPRKEAQEIINNYFARFPGVQTYIDETLAFARDNGYVETLLGRRRYLRDINSRNQTVRATTERIAINAPIQGTAADMIKIAMVRVHKALHQAQLSTKLLLQVHDELVLEAPHSEVDAVKSLLQEHMTAALPLSIPVIVQIGTGANWLDAH